MRRIISGMIIAVASASCLVACGSRSPQVTVFTFSEVGDTAAGVQTAEMDGLRVLIGPANFPRYLSRPQLVSRRDGGELRVDEFNRWGGPLPDEFLRAVADEVSRGLQTPRVVVYPVLPPFALDYSVAFQVQSFETDTDGSVVLRCLWAVTDVDSGESVAAASFSGREPAARGDVRSRVAAHRALVVALAEDVVRRLRELEAGRESATARAADPGA